MPKQSFNIILLGDPAAGKATQAQYLRKKYKLFDLDMGKELRKIKNLSKNSQLKKIFAKTLDKGKLTPTKIVREIFKQRIAQVPKTKNILFDGTPKMIGEAKLVYKLLQKFRRANNVQVIYLSIPQKEILKRMGKRLEYFKGKYSKRADDSAVALKNRISYYHKNIAEVKKFFNKIYGIHEISGLGTKPEVFKKIEKVLEHKHELNQD